MKSKEQILAEALDIPVNDVKELTVEGDSNIFNTPNGNYKVINEKETESELLQEFYNLYAETKENSDTMFVNQYKPLHLTTEARSNIREYLIDEISKELEIDETAMFSAETFDVHKKAKEKADELIEQKGYIGAMMWQGDVQTELLEFDAPVGVEKLKFNDEKFRNLLLSKDENVIVKDDHNIYKQNDVLTREQAIMAYFSEQDDRKATVLDIVKDREEGNNHYYLTPLGELNVMTTKEADDEMVNHIRRDFEEYGTEIFINTDNATNKKIFENMFLPNLTEEAVDNLLERVKDEIRYDIEENNELPSLLDYFKITEDEYNENESKYISQYADYLLEDETPISYLESRGMPLSEYKDELEFDYKAVANILEINYGRANFISSESGIECTFDDFVIFEENRNKTLQYLSDIAEDVCEAIADYNNINISPEKIIDLVAKGELDRESLETNAYEEIVEYYDIDVEEDIEK